MSNGYTLELYPSKMNIFGSLLDFENIVEKGENAGNQHFLLFQQCFFCPSQNQFQYLSYLLSANAFNLDQSKILSFGEELNVSNTCHIFFRQIRDNGLHFQGFVLILC